MAFEEFKSTIEESGLFDKKFYLKTYRDARKADGTPLDHFVKVGLKEDRMPNEHFDPAWYREYYEDVREDEVFPFIHYLLYGKSEGRNQSEKSETIENFDEKNKPQVIALIGLPRSGLTLAGALGSLVPDVDVWFLPHATRKNEGIWPFTDFESLKAAYRKAFPKKEANADTFILSESTSDIKNIEFMFKSLSQLRQNGVNVKVLWLIRNLNHNYLSQVEAAHKYWGAPEPDYSPESYNSYLDFARQSYFSIAEHIADFEHRIVSYSSMVTNPKKFIECLSVFAGKENIPTTSIAYEELTTLSIAGDPGFSIFTGVDTSRTEARELSWQRLVGIAQEVEKPLLLLVDVINKIVVESTGTWSNCTQIAQQWYSDNFDTAYYLSHNEDVRLSGIDPLEHYHLYGWKENRKPTEWFDTQWYRENYFDDGETDSFMHFLKLGRFFTELGKIESQGIMQNLKIIDPESYEITDDLVLIAPKFKHPKVSIIVPAYNEENYTMACIESIIKNTEDGVSYEIILMDDKSPDESARLIERNLKNVKFITNGVNYGFLLNCNKGATFAIGEYLLFLNNDTNVQPGWLSSLVELIESADDIGMVGSRLVYPTGQQQEAGGIIWNDASGWNFGRLDDPNKPEYNYVKEADYLTGAAMMIRTSLWEEIGGFDERYVPAYYEDSDLAFEVRKHGYRTLYQPKSVVIHFEGISNGTDLGSGIKKYQVVNKENFFNKWQDVLKKEHFPNSQDVFLARDHSRFKKHILIIDHYVPHFDQDAGSRTMWQYLLLFKELGYHVTFAGDNFYKHEPYTSLLEAQGIEVLYGNYYAKNFDTWLKNNGKYFDVAYLLRPHISIKYIEKIRKYTQATIFYNGTDFHFLRMQREYDITGNSQLLIDLEKTKKDEIKLFKMADCVLTISEYEKDFFKREFSDWNVELIPTYIYTERLPLSTNSFDKREGILFVGGFVHKPNIEGIKWFLEKIWPLILQEIPDIKFYIVGSNMPNELVEMKSDNIIPKGFVSDEELAELYNSSRVSIAPLTFGAGVKGKIIEAICNGLPTVTTPVGAEGIVDASKILSIKNTEEEFSKGVLALYSNKKMWEKYRKRQSEYAKKHFSVHNVKTYIDEIFSKDYK